MGALTLSQNTSPRHEAAICQFNVRTPQSQPPQEQTSPMSVSFSELRSCTGRFTLVQPHRELFLPPRLPPNKGRVGQGTVAFLFQSLFRCASSEIVITRYLAVRVQPQSRSLPTSEGGIYLFTDREGLTSKPQEEAVASAHIGTTERLGPNLEILTFIKI